MVKKYSLLLVFSSTICIGFSCSDKLTNNSDCFLTTAGSNSFDEAYGLAVDLDSSVVVAGIFNDVLCFVDDSTELVSGGLMDIFIAKYSRKGELLWAKSVGTTSNDEGYNVAVDSARNIYITGYITNVTSNLSNILVMKLNAAGEIVWQKTFPSTGPSEGNDIQWTKGELILTGLFNKEITVEEKKFNSKGGSDIFIARMNENGKVLNFQTYGFIQNDNAKNICLLPNNEIALCGSITKNQNEDLAFLKFNRNLRLISSSVFGSKGNDRALSIISGSKGEYYLCAQFEGDSIFTKSKVFPVKYLGKSDGMICKLDSKGNPLWIYTLGSPDNDWVTDASFTKDSTLVFITVLNRNAEIVLDKKSHYKGKGSADIYLTLLDRNDREIKSTGYGNSSEDGANRIFIDKNNTVYLCGWFDKTLQFPDALKQVCKENGDAFLFKGKLEKLIGK